jgi:hypothetical protein
MMVLLDITIATPMTPTLARRRSAYTRMPVLSVKVTKRGHRRWEGSSMLY